jgi:hypothetical protein
LNSERGVSRKEGGKVLSDTDRAHTGSSTTVRDSKGLVKIEMTDVTTTGSGIGKSNLGVKVSAIKIDLTAILMDNLARVLNTALKDAKG